MTKELTPHQRATGRGLQRSTRRALKDLMDVERELLFSVIHTAGMLDAARVLFESSAVERDIIELMVRYAAVGERERIRAFANKKSLGRPENTWWTAERKEKLIEIADREPNYDAAVAFFREYYKEEIGDLKVRDITLNQLSDSTSRENQKSERYRISQFNESLNRAIRAKIMKLRGDRQRTIEMEDLESDFEDVPQ